MPSVKRSTGRHCSVFNCSNNNRRLFEWNEEMCEMSEEGHLGQKHRDCPCVRPFSFCMFPREPSIRQEWVKRINRKDFFPGRYAVVCTKHFVDGRPTVNNPYPALELGYEHLNPNKTARRKLIRTVATPVCSQQKAQNSNQATSVEQSEGLTVPQEQPLDNSKETVCACGNKQKPETCDNWTQWDDHLVDHQYTKKQDLFSSKSSSGTQTSLPALTCNLLTEQDYVFYTSLHKNMFFCLVATLMQFVKPRFGKISMNDQVLLVLCRLRLGLLYGDLSRRFNVSRSLASKVFNFWLPILAEHLRNFIVWLPRDTIQMTLPDCFKTKYPNTTCIIDCTEIILERARSHWMRVVTYSNYKSRNTIKFLIAIAPNGLIMFLSDSFGGRASDKMITEKCGILDYLLPGDQVMADRGFLIEDILPPGVKFNIPPFTKGKTHLSEGEVTKGRRIASVRVHVERVIAQVKKFRILKNNFPISQSSNVDHIITICAGLCNLQSPIIKKKQLTSH